MSESLQIVRPLHSFERVPEYLPIIDMLIPKMCHVAYVRAPQQDTEDRMRRVWATRRLMSKQRRAESVARIQPMLAEGKSSYYISEVLGFSRTTVDRYIQKNGLERPVLHHPTRKIFIENEAEIRELVKAIGVPKTAAKFGFNFNSLSRFLERS